MSIANGLRTFFKLRQERHDSGVDDLPACSMPLVTELHIYSKRRLTMNMALPMNLNRSIGTMNRKKGERLRTELVAASMPEAKHIPDLWSAGSRSLWLRDPVGVGTSGRRPGRPAEREVRPTLRPE